MPVVTQFSLSFLMTRLPHPFALCGVVFSKLAAHRV